jgi:hypothetical protein
MKTRDPKVVAFLFALLGFVSLLGSVGYYVLRDPPQVAAAKRYAAKLQADLPAAPAGLSPKNTALWETARKSTSVLSIRAVALDPAVLESNSITVNEGGKSYVFKGQARQTKIVGPKSGPVPAIIWEGVLDNGISTARITYLPEHDVIDGEFSLGGRYFRLVGDQSGSIWTEIAGGGGFEPAARPPQSSASGVQQ